VNITESKTSTALPAMVGDGFDGYSDHTEGADSPQPQGIIRGTHLKFGATAQWERRDGEIIEPDVKLIVTDIVRAVLKWDVADKTKRPETSVISPGQPFPDVAAMNSAIPKEQWRQGPAGLQGPYQTQQAVVMVEPRSMEEFTYTTSTIGGFIAVRELVDKVKVMRKYRGPVSPIVTLGDVPMRTRFGERCRPYFNIVDWVHMAGGDEPQQAALPAPDKPGPNDNTTSTIIEAEPVKAEPIKEEPAPAAAVSPDTPAKKRRRSKPSLRHAKPLTLEEEMNDSIPW
jgi:hypothetical protein